MTEAQLLADLIANYGFLLVDPTGQALSSEDGKGITLVSVEVVEGGLSEKNQKPLAIRKSITYLVYHRGQGDEWARYEGDEPVNTSLKDISTPNGSFLSYATIYSNTTLRNRLLGWLIKTAGTTLIAVYDNTSALPSTPTLNDQYVAKVTANGWTAAHKYKWNGSIWVDGGVWTKKNKWATACFKLPEDYLKTVMMYISQDPAVRSKGVTATDDDMAWLAYMISNICDMYGFTD